MILRLNLISGANCKISDFGKIFDDPLMRPAKGETIVSEDGREYEIVKVVVQNFLRQDNQQNDLMWEYFVKEISDETVTADS